MEQNKGDEYAINIFWYIALSTGTWFGIINIVRYFKVNKEVVRLKREITRLKNEIIGKDETIIRQAEYIKQLEAK